MTRDPQFGPMLMFGLGGIFVEVMKDVTFYLAPITEDEAIQMLKSTRSYEMLKGKRGSKEVDIHAIAGALQRISQLTTDFPQIVELDINPLIVGEIGSDPVVADARMTFAPKSRFSIIATIKIYFISLPNLSPITEYSPSTATSIANIIANFTNGL